MNTIPTTQNATPAPDNDRARFVAEVKALLSDLSDEDVLMVYATSQALIALQRGQMAPDDAAQFRALKAVDPMDLEAIDTWLSAHGYPTAVE